MGISGSSAYRWTDAGGIVALGDPPEGANSSFAFGLYRRLDCDRRPGTLQRPCCRGWSCWGWPRAGESTEDPSDRLTPGGWLLGPAPGDPRGAVIPSPVKLGSCNRPPQSTHRSFLWSGSSADRNYERGFGSTSE